MTDYVRVLTREIARAKVTLGNLAVDCLIASVSPMDYQPGYDQVVDAKVYVDKVVPTEFETGDFPDTQITVEDKTVLYMIPQVVVKPQDFLKINDVEYRVAGPCMNTSAGNTVVLQKLLLRPQPAGISWDLNVQPITA